MQTRHLALPVLLCLFNPNIQAETCAIASMTDNLDITLPCLQIDSDVYSTGLELVSEWESDSLIWQWNEVLEETNCTPDPTRCTTLDDDWGLNISALDFNGLNLNAKLSYDTDLPEMSWRYVSHTVNQVMTMPVTSALDDAALAKLRQYMNSVVGIDKQVPGAVLGVAQGSSILMTEAFGLSDVSTNTAMTTDNLLHIASTNKALTSFMLAALVDEGVLQWNTRAQEIYPAFATADPQTSGNITIRQLLDMSSGLPEEGDLDTDEPARQLFEQLSKQTLVGKPGGQFKYSNLGVSLAGYLGVLAVAKKDHGQITEEDMNNLYSDYVALLKTKVLNPIGMKNSFVPRAEAVATGRMAKSHILQNGTFVVAKSKDVEQDNGAPSGGLKSTVGDMLRYIITDMQQGVNPDGARVASVTNVSERQKLSPGPATDEKYGLGLEVIENQNGLRYVGHTGSFDSFNSVMGFFPDKQIAFVLLTNGDGEAAEDLTENDFLATLADLLNTQ